jgi:hypothetical protein
VLTVLVGMGRNMYTWKINRKYIRLYGEGGIAKQDVEARVPDEDEVPFGIKALQRGIEVEGVWISRNNTPIHSPILSAHPSPTPSIFGSVSTNSLILPPSSHSNSDLFMPESPTPLRGKAFRPPSSSADSFRSLSISRASLDTSFDFQIDKEPLPGTADSNTLDALEGRGRSWRRRCIQVSQTMGTR